MYNPVELVHNGMNITYHNNINQAYEKIEDILKFNEDLKPKKILELTENNIVIIIYEYRTLYKEMFYIKIGEC